MSPDQVDDCAEYLSKRCESKSLVVKSKALRAIRTFCVRAPATFRQKMARHSVVVRACASHTGAPHPLKGDAPHKQVRDLADEAVRAIFDGGDAGVSRPSPNANPPGERRTAAGVPIVDDAPIGHDGNPRLRKTTGTWGGEERREGFGLRGAYASSSESSEKKDDQTASGAFAPASTAAGTFLASAESPRRADKSSPGDGNTSLRSDTGTGGGLFRQEGSEEQRRVDAACARGGVKLAPSAEVLAAFTRQCEGLRPEGVAAALAAKFAAARLAVPPNGSLVEASERRRDAFKAACCLEACARSEGGGARRVAGLFRASPGNDAADALRALAESGGESGEALAEKAKAAAVAVARGAPLASTSLQSRKGTTVSAAASESARGPGPGPGPGPATSSTSSVDFFGLEGLATGAGTGASVPPVPVPVLVPVPAAAPAVDDLLGGLSLGGAPARTTQPQMLTQQQMLTQPQMPTRQQTLTQPQMLTQQQQMLMQQQHYAQHRMMVSHAQSAMSPTPLRPPNVSAASPTTGNRQTVSGREKTNANAPRAPAALVGGPSAYAPRKEAGAFDFVSDLLGSEKKK